MRYDQCPGCPLCTGSIFNDEPARPTQPRPGATRGGLRLVVDNTRRR
jgi:hypothetical protein